MESRKVKDILFTFSCYLAALIVMIPLFDIIIITLIKGIPAINLEFLTSLPRPPGEAGGGVANAIRGTAILMVLTMGISVPISLFIAIYLAEFPGGRIKEAVHTTVDTFAGVPSIITGVFVYTLIVIEFGFSALAGAMALSIIAIPIMTRTAEGALRLVPDEVREAGLSLGIRRWKVITRIVLRTALPAIASGTLLALARIAGETAPLLFTAFGSFRYAADIFHPVSALPLVIYVYAISPYPDWHEKAWGSALILMVLILAINLLVKYKLRRWSYGG